MAGILEKTYRGIMQGLNYEKQLDDGPLYWQTTIEDDLVTFEN